jgi:hypothetical protein
MNHQTHNYIIYNSLSNLVANERSSVERKHLQLERLRREAAKRGYLSSESSSSSSSLTSKGGKHVKKQENLTKKKNEGDSDGQIELPTDDKDAVIFEFCKI